MATLNSSEFIHRLIGTGADASLNLYDVKFTIDESSSIQKGIEDFRYRITSIPSVQQRDSSTTDLPYMNTFVSIPTNGTTIPKTSTFTMRVDDNYDVIEKLRGLQLIGSNGEYSKDSKEIPNITFTSYKSDTDGQYSSIYTWKYHRCYITTVSPLSFSYDSSSQGSVTVGFVFKGYEEGRPNE